MSGRSHRESTLRRREALLRAAVEIVAESGPGAVTHRGVAARASLPPATTSYFFPAISDLLGEAIRTFTGEQAAAYEHLAEQIGAAPPDEFAGTFARALLGGDRTVELAQVEAYLHAARDPELRPAAAAVRTAFETAAARALTTAGVTATAELTGVLVAYVDGFLLHHLADPRPDDEAALRDGLEYLARVDLRPPDVTG